MRPWMWNNGMVLRHTSAGFICTVEEMHKAPQAMLACVRGTILGFFVVPDVWRTRARCSLFTDAKGLPIGSPLSGLPAACFLSSKRPATSLEGSSSRSFSTFAFRATLIAFPELFWSSSDCRLSFACTTNALAGRSRNSNSYSSRLSPMFSGAKVQRKAKAKKHTAASGPFGMAVQSRSSRPRPNTSTASLVTKLRSSLKVSGLRPSTACKKGSSLSGRRS
mmetsp:Transcript_86989/g.243883  ORF Transcript_86989/g.243883 Transcript_86989/m.243883 type:complete len:221 (-) Transcript_86989:212-874(-)